MKLSIITINYNNSDGLQRTIESVLSQTWKDYEWIVIDGGSTDGSLDIIKKYASHFSFWCSEPDKGIYNAMNKGITHAKGEYLNFLNSGDCYYDTNSIQNIFRNNPTCDVLYGNSYWGLDKKYIFNSPKSLTLDYFIEGSLGHAASFISRHLFESYLYDEKYRIVSDWKNWIKWLIEGKNFKHIDVAVSCFDTSGISSTNKELDAIERNSVWKELLSPSIKEILFRCHEYEKSRVNNPELEQIETLITKRYIYRKIFRLVKKILMFIENYD